MRINAALGMEDGEAGADLLGEREQVELRAEATVIALLGLFQTREVLLERGIRLPRRAVDALELRAVLVAAPVRAGDASCSLNAPSRFVDGTCGPRHRSTNAEPSARGLRYSDTSVPSPTSDASTFSMMSSL